MRAHHHHILASAVVAMVSGPAAWAQVAYPDHTIQNVSWSSGTHNTAVTQKIISPGAASQPVYISGTAEAEFVSGTQVRLMPGFHAGDFTGNGQHFRARIDPNLGPDGDVVTIAPDPGTSVQDNIIHVPKWEKFEIGLQLPEDYQAAIDSFFVHYYSGPDTMVATPGNVDPVYDLNPYADDSLQLLMRLTGPSGQQLLKWGFFMREAMWADSVDPLAALVADTAIALDLYTIRFRFAPDEEGAWQFALSVKAPHSMNASNTLLQPYTYTGFTFACDPALPDNRGTVRVNEANNRVLKFENGEPFVGLGVNLLSQRQGNSTLPSTYHIVKRDLEQITEAMPAMHAEGANYARMFLMYMTFAPEYVNLGVYDRYKAALTCGAPPIVRGNCQYQCWAFDQVLDAARDNEIYIQLCIDPYPPIIDYETFTWQYNPYQNGFVEPRDSATGQFDMTKFFYRDGDASNTSDGVFYYWKRKYKYILSRWGYSVNIPVIEPFNEIDQMLTYGYRDLRQTSNALCAENKIEWFKNDSLPVVIDQWITDLAAFVRDPVDINDPVHSPLGEDKKLFLMSYTDGRPYTDTAHYRPFTNPSLDLIDVHKGLGSVDAVNATFDESQNFHNTYTNSGNKKPFHHGEYSSFGETAGFSTWKYFSNYDISFHNELWASTFMGNFSTGLSWARERVFWWSDGLPDPPSDTDPFLGNQYQQMFSSERDSTNLLDIGVPNGYPVVNRTAHHHFKPLSDLLTNPDWQSYDFFNGAYSARKAVDTGHRIECYYLIDTTHTLAIGWIHNREAYWEKGYYAKRSVQDLLGCSEPPVDWHTIHGFQPGLDYHVSWFPTHMNTSACPVNYVDSSGTGAITLDLATAPFGDTVQYFLDTLHADYAFIVSLNPVMRGMNAHAPEGRTTWDFSMYPNPTSDLVNVVLPEDEVARTITLYDLMGKQVYVQNNVNGRLHGIQTEGLARGTYCVRVSDGKEAKMKTLILQ